MILKSIKYTLIIISTLFSISAYVYSSTVRSSLIGFSEFREIESNLYVSPNIVSTDDQSIAFVISDARSRISEKFGPPISKPTIIIIKGTKEQKQFELYGAPGKVLISPFGNYLLLNHELMNVDIAAHELMHTEIAERLGYFTRMSKMPTWLDEGIALQVDHRPKYTQLKEIDRVEFARVISLSTPRSFWSENSEQNIINYQSAKMAVSRAVLPAIEKNGLYNILEEIRMGESAEKYVEFKN